MNTKSVFLFLVLLATILSACQATQPPATEAVVVVEQPTNIPLPTDTAVPTNTALPTETPKPTNTPLSEGVLFRDDFNGSLQPGWTWEEEDPERWSFVDVNGKQWLQIVGDSGRTNVLKREAPSGNFAITAHIKADPYLNFHQANIFIFQDSENYIAINTGYCEPCPTGGYGYYMETAASGGDVLGHFYSVPRAAEDTDVYLKIELVDDVISGYFATSPGEWTRVGRFGNSFELSSVGLGATNSSPPSGTPEDIIAQFDYFEISSP